MVAAHMKLVSVIAVMLSIGLPGSVDAAPRVALVRIKEIYTELPSTAELAKQVKEERAELGKDKRAVELRRSIAELLELQASLTNKDNQADEAMLQKIARSYELKVQETRAIQQEYEEFRTEEEKRISLKEVEGMRASLNRIMDIARKLSKERGYDLVFEDSGNSNTGLPFILYSKNATDLTPEVRAALQDADRAANKPADKANTQAKP